MRRYGDRPCPDPEGVAWFLRGAHRRISKNHDKGWCGMKAPQWGTNTVGDGGKKIWKTAERFLLAMGVLGGGAHQAKGVRRNAVRRRGKAFPLYSFRSLLLCELLPRPGNEGFCSAIDEGPFVDDQIKLVMDFGIFDFDTA